jgi:hypothetical protein
MVEIRLEKAAGEQAAAPELVAANTRMVNCRLEVPSIFQSIDSAVL